MAAPRDPTLATARIPRATYRLQLRAEFDFDAARALLPYLDRLGISHVYCSPIATARPGSAHGYDVVDPTTISAELGGRAGFVRLAHAARALGMGLLIDQVPNHMGVFGSGNAWWSDVLEHGEGSPYAHYFDIDWRPPNRALHGKLLLPILGDVYGAVLDRGEIRLVADADSGGLALACHDHRFPLDPRSYPMVLRHEGASAEVGALAQAFDELPPRDALAPADRDLRHRKLPALKQRLAALIAAAALDERIEQINTETSRDALHALHEAQAWRLAFWRTAADEINYRRFFDINELAALRIEEEDVFEATQGLALDLAAEGLVDGLRIDHPDGLADPAQYFERLQQGYRQRCAALPPDPGRPGALYVVAEKIAAGFEGVPPEWPVHGTTGYRFGMLVNGLFVERRQAARMERIWRSHAGVAEDFADTVRACKRSAARSALGAQLTSLAHALQRIALSDRHSRDFGYDSLRDALAEIAACMPVYRTYLGPSGAASEQDRRFVEWAVAQALRAADPADAPMYAFIQRCLLAEFGADGEAEGSQAHAQVQTQVRRFVQRWQQYCAPVAAKGVEDTAFYRYHRLSALNEVGGDPAVFGISAAAFHGASTDRATHWPHTMLATSTHDNKRAEDVRCRIDVLSERPAVWWAALRRWKTATRTWRTGAAGSEAPSASDQFLLHQTLLGTWPADGLSAEALPGYRARIEAYLLKAAREAKQHTSWARPNPEYEGALQRFVQQLLGRVESNPVLAELERHARELAWFGALNSAAMTTLKLTSPGVPDTYQGTEMIDLSLVDPDNRRAVDFARRDALLDEFEASWHAPERAARLQQLAAAAPDGRLKLWIVWRLLALRRAEPGLFEHGRYAPLRVLGPQRHHVIAFARRTPQATLLVVSGRKFASLGSPAGQLPGAASWSGTRLVLPAWVPRDVDAADVLTGTSIAVGGTLELASLFGTLPCAVVHLPQPRGRGA